MKRIIVVLVLMNTASVAISQTVPNYTGSKISQEEAQLALDFHNKARKDVGVNNLSWSGELAQYAQQWANYLANDNNCIIEHRSSKGKNPKGYGENIFWGSGLDYTALYASQAWYSEINKYTYRKITSQNYYATGHYTQMVWKNTREVGIGKATCPDGAIIIVANYDPPGNYIGETPY